MGRTRREDEAIGFALFLLFSYALSWGCGCLGIVSKGPFLYRRRTTG